MVQVNIREFVHQFSKYLRKVKRGNRIVILERNIPIADMTPHNENVTKPGWKRTIKKVALQGKALSETVVRGRQERDQ